MKSSEKIEKFVRLNSRVLPKHIKFIKQEASRLTKFHGRVVSEGEVNRNIIEFYIANHKN